MDPPKAGIAGIVSGKNSMGCKRRVSIGKYSPIVKSGRINWRLIP
jgi:hypothetical protein